MYQHGFLKVATASPKVFVGDPIANVEMILKALEVAQQHKAGIMVFPELSVCGYTCGDLLFQTYLLEDVKKAISDSTKVAREINANDEKARLKQLRRDN